MAERLTLSKTLDTPSEMKHFIVIIALLAICSCKTRPHRENIEVVFSPGLVDMNKIDPDIINSIKNPDKVYTITSDDYTFLHDVLSSRGTIIPTKEETPRILIKVDDNICSISAHNTFQSNNKTYFLSNKDAYRVKSIVHFYDFIDEVNLQDIKEIKQFGMPNNYEYCSSEPKKPTKSFVKIVLKEE